MHRISGVNDIMPHTKKKNSIVATAPVLKLVPLKPGSFVAKVLDLSQPVLVGRQVTTGEPPLENNGVFNSLVLSRNHAIVLFENGKVLIRDTGSSNGTYLNGNRLSPEATESALYELQSGDVLEFGVDFISDDSSKGTRSLLPLPKGNL